MTPIPGNYFLNFWAKVIVVVLWHTSHARYHEAFVDSDGRNNPQRMWDPEKGNILGRDRMDVDGLENVTAQIGSTAYLHCPVDDLADKQISWIRRRDYQILTSGLHTYSRDLRFNVVVTDTVDDWALQIKFVQERDEGPYECHVSTRTGRYSHLVNLKVVIPEAVISGSSQIHVESGSTFSLFCIIEGTLIPPQFIFWYHNNKMINYDQSRGGIIVTMGNIDFPSSRITVANASFKDSGEYKCSTTNTKPSSVHVYVYEGDKTAAIQSLDSGSNGNRSCLSPLLIILVTLQVVVGLFRYFAIQAT